MTAPHHVVVIGAGTAGCVVASRLAERAGRHVTLLEAGPGDLGPDSRGASYLDAVAAPGRMWESPHPQGRGVGGSTAVNGMLATMPGRGQLRRLGLLRYHRIVADAQPERSASAGDDDFAAPDVLLPSEVAGRDELGPLDRALLAAEPAAARVPLARRGGLRVTVGDAYLDPGPPTLEVRPNATVARILLDAGRAVGAVLDDGEIVSADFVIVCAGALHTPALLRRSGLTDEAIGAGLLDHPSLAVGVQLRDVPDPHSLVTATAWRPGGLELMPMNHIGPAAPGRAAMIAGVLDPVSSGRVVVPEDGEPYAELVVANADRQRLADAEGLARELLGRGPFREVIASVDPDITAGSYSHACASCREVLGDDGAVRGTKGLYVCDASALPEIPASGTMLPTIAWAERFAARFRPT